MDSIFEFVTTPEIDHSDSPEIEGRYHAPVAEKVATDLDTLKAMSLQTQQALNALAQQNAQTVQTLGQSIELQRQALTRPQPTAQESSVDWGKVLSGSEATTEKPKKGETQAVGLTPEQVQQMAVNAAKGVLADNQRAYQAVNAATAQYEAHFRDNHRELHPYYDLIKDRFGLETARGADMGTAYNNAVQWGYNALKGGYLAKPTPRPQPMPQGGSGSTGGWAPGTYRTDARPQVKDMAGNIYTVERYLGRKGPDAVPLVDYPEEFEERQAKQYADYRTTRDMVTRYKLHPGALDEFKEAHQATAW